MLHIYPLHLHPSKSERVLLLCRSPRGQNNIQQTETDDEVCEGDAVSGIIEGRISNDSFRRPSKCNILPKGR